MSENVSRKITSEQLRFFVEHFCESDIRLSEFERKLCDCATMLTMRNRTYLNPTSRALEVKAIKAAESGKYFCIADHKQVDSIENEDIITRISLFVIQKSSATFVQKFNFADKVRSGLFSNIDVTWDVLDPVGCSDCGEFGGERIQMALCSTNDNGQEGFEI